MLFQVIFLHRGARTQHNDHEMYVWANFLISSKNVALKNLSGAYDFGLMIKLCINIRIQCIFAIFLSKIYKVYNFLIKRYIIDNLLLP